MKTWVKQLLLVAFIGLIGTANAQITVDTIKTRVVYITKTGLKYHATNCGYLRKSKIEIKLSKAKIKGYTPCSRCKGLPVYKTRVKGNVKNKSLNRDGNPTQNRERVSVRCSGITQKGTRCKLLTSHANGKCKHHQ